MGKTQQTPLEQGKNRRIAFENDDLIVQIETR